MPAIFIYKILVPNQSALLKPLVYSTIIGLVISASSLSTFMFGAYKAIAYENPESEIDFYRRTKVSFPSGSDLNLINFFRSEVANLKTSYIAFQGNEKDSYRLVYLLDSFSAFPSDKYLENPIDLNASSPDEFYRSLDHNSIKYLVLSQGDISRQGAFSPGVMFALESFPRPYQDNNYVVLEIPDLHTSQSASVEKDIGLIYRKGQLSPSSVISNQSLLVYNDKFFDRLTNNSSAYVINGNKTTIRLNPDPDKGITLWTNPILNKNVNYVETDLRLIAENKTKNDFGIKWKDDNNKEYYISFSDESLSLKRKSLSDPDDREQVLHTNQEVVGERGLWHNVKIVFLNQSISVYVDDTLRAGVPKDQLNGYPINVSQIGLRAYKNTAQFGPLRIGHWQNEPLSDDGFIGPSNSYLYYVIGGLGLSKIGYDDFIDVDFSAFSKKKIILTFDPLQGSEEVSRYLEFVKSGGTLIVMDLDRDNNSQGTFSKLLSIHKGNRVGFDTLASTVKGESIRGEVTDGKLGIQEQHYINISGETPRIEITNSSDVSIKSFYANKNQMVAPFGIEKSLGMGKIIFVNAIGYLEALSKSPEQPFFTLSNISNLIGLVSDSNYTKGHSVGYSDSYDYYGRNKGTILDDKIVGPIELSGHTILKSPSVFIPGDGTNFSFYVRNISIINQSNQHEASFTAGSTDSTPKSDREKLDTIKIKDLKLYGPYEAAISTNGSVLLPTMSSHEEYVGISLPTRFNAKVNLSNNAYAQFSIDGEDQDRHALRIANGSMYLEAIPSSSDLNSTSIVMRTPEIHTNGRFSFEEYGKPKTEIEDGILLTKIDHVDHYHDRNRNESRTQYITYLNDFQIEGNIVSDNDQNNLELLLPGDISDRAKSSGVRIPLQKVILSEASVILMISIAVLAGIGAHYWLHIRKERK